MKQDLSFRISPRWRQSPQDEERDLAEISISVGDRVVTRIDDITTGHTRDFFRASAVSLALWLADNWWRLRWEPIVDYRSVRAEWRLRHDLTSASGGTLWPPMMIYGVGDRVVIAPIAMGSKAGDRVDYHPIPVSLVPATAFEDGVDAFFDAVTTTCARAQDGASLKLVLAQLQEERQTPDVASWRRLEARLGYDPDQVPDALIEALSRQEELIGAEGVEEAALGNPGARAPEILEKVLSASRESSVEIDLAEALAAAAPVNRADLRRPIWMVAEDAADRLRRAVGWSEGPFSNVALSDILKVSWKAIRAATATARDLPYGARLRGGGTTEKIALQTQASHDRRFELARVLGDALWTADSRFGVISRGKTDRQKFQRAFAQSLLCPFADLSRHVDLSGPSEEQIAKAARRYLVNRNVVTTLLVNKGHLSRETLGDVLDAA